MLDQFKNKLIEILVIASTEYDGYEKVTKNYTSCEQFREDILKNIENYDFNENTYTDKDEDTEEGFDDFENSIPNQSNKMDQFLQEIRVKVL